LVNLVSTTIKVSKSTKEKLVRVAAKLQERYGHRVSLDEAIRYLLELEERKPELLDSIIGSVPTLSVEELYRERRRDEERIERRYSI